jgi:hypothetical protein
MTTWTTISNSAVAVGGIPSSSTVTALRDNPSAMAEAANGAPVVFAGWHPIDKVTVGDGKTGLIYDYAVNGTAADVITPNFQDGYEYRICASNLLCDSAAGNVRINIDGYFETDAIYKRLRYSSEGTGTAFHYGFDIEFQLPRIANIAHIVPGWTYRSASFSNVGVDTDSYESPAQKLLRAKVFFTSGNIVGGKIYFFRRREYASSP